MRNNIENDFLGFSKIHHYLSLTFSVNIRLAEMATPYVKYHKSTKVANKYCFHYEKTSENCMHLRSKDNARKHTENQQKTSFLLKIVTLVGTHHIVPTWFQAVCIHFALYKASWLKKNTY